MDFRYINFFSASDPPPPSVQATVATTPWRIPQRCGSEKAGCRDALEGQDGRGGSRAVVEAVIGGFFWGGGFLAGTGWLEGGIRGTWFAGLGQPQKGQRGGGLPGTPFKHDTPGAGGCMDCGQAFEDPPPWRCSSWQPLPPSAATGTHCVAFGRRALLEAARTALRKWTVLGRGVGTRPRYSVVCLWQRPLAFRHRSF